MSSYRARRSLQNDDSTHPTLFKVIESQSFKSNETVLSYLDGFLASNDSENDKLLTAEALNTESLKTSSTYSGLNPAVVAQLNRLQRNLRGLPPVFDTPSAPSSKENNEIETEKVNKKIVFDD